MMEIARHTVGDFTSGTDMFSGDALGWTPAITTPDPADDVSSATITMTLLSK